LTSDTDHPDWPLRTHHDEYYLLFHSARCAFHQAHPVSVITAREMLWNALLRCTDNSCFVTLGRTVKTKGAPRITREEVHTRYKKITGHRPGYVSREDRRGITDPKTTRELVTWMGQEKERREREAKK